MNMGKHAAWMMNPNLSEADVMRLVEEDCDRELALFKEMIDQAREIARTKGRGAALDYVGMFMPIILCS